MECGGICKLAAAPADQRKDWKDLKTKPVDFPFGPYADGFSEKQHKYGSGANPIAAAQKSTNQ